MATVHRGWQRDNVPPDVHAERARKATIASRRITDAACRGTVRYAQTRTAEEITEFINAGQNVWLHERQAWLDAVIAEETKNGGSAFGR
jgi:hypothetical protein